jgi:DNA-binding transcriptional LysR family regulator
MELKWLKDFLALSALGNFRMAAQQRSVSQPAFSRRIQAIEAWIGTTLIDRSGQPSQLTEAGRVFLPVAQRIVDLAEAGKEDVQTLVREDKEKIRFSTLTTLAHVFMPSWLKSLQPYIVADQFIVRTEYDTVADYFAAVQDNSVDFFICYEDPRNRLFNNDSVFASLKLGEATLVPVISPDDKGAPRWWLPDSPTGPIPCLHTLVENSPSPVRYHMASKYSHLTFKSVYESSSAPTLKAMAIEGFGLAWIPSAYVAADLALGRLVRAADPVDDLFVEINIYRSTKHDKLRVERFWQVLVQQKARARDAVKANSP